jgi:hypothetical protein
MGPTENVAEFVSAAIEASGKSQVQIAQETGFEHPNIVTMIKKGQANPSQPTLNEFLFQCPPNGLSPTNLSPLRHASLPIHPANTDKLRRFTGKSMRPLYMLPNLLRFCGKEGSRSGTLVLHRSDKHAAWLVLNFDSRTRITTGGPALVLTR